jgi:hypothetical protein
VKYLSTAIHPQSCCGASTSPSPDHS